MTTPSTLEITWPDGTQTALPYLWLRDNCACSECRVEQTTEKKFHLINVPVDLVPQGVDLAGDELHLVWPDGHHTRYSGADIRAVVTPAAPGWQTWGRDFQPRRTDYAKFLGDNPTAIDTITDFLHSGVAILTDAPKEANRLEDLAPRLGPVREVLFERIHTVQIDPGGYNVAHTALPLPPHNDFASYSWPPSVQGLHMLVNEVAGGKSVIVDGWAVLHQLRDDHPDMFAALCSMPVPFREFNDDNETYAVAPLVQYNTEGEISVFRYSNQLMQAMDPTRPGVADFYRAYHELSLRITADEAKVSFRLEGGQILLVAGHRVLHGREPFQPTGQRLLQDAYYEHDNIRNQLAVLKRRVAEHG